MAISALASSGHFVTAARAAYELSAVRSVRSRTVAAPAAPAQAATSVRISESAELLAKLHQFHDADPKGFKRALGEMAHELQAEAAQSSGAQTTQLSRLAERFAEAAKDGNLTPLVPAIETGARARAQYVQTQDALVAPSESVRSLFRGFVERVNAVLASAPPSQTGSSLARFSASGQQTA